MRARLWPSGHKIVGREVEKPVRALTDLRQQGGVFGQDAHEVEPRQRRSRAFAAFGVKPTQYRSAIESLLRRLTKKGDIPSISTLVDIGNLVSIRHRLPVAFLDLAHVTGATTVSFATGNERFTDLGSSESIHPAAGEVIFADEAELVSARRWCWRQSAESATKPDTTEVLITVEGHHEGAAADVAAAVTAVGTLLATYQPAAQIEMSAVFSPSTGWTSVAVA